MKRRRSKRAPVEFARQKPQQTSPTLHILYKQPVRQCCVFKARTPPATDSTQILQTLMCVFSTVEYFLH